LELIGMKQLIALIIIAFLVPTTAAMAKSPCKEDKAKFCKDAKAGGKKVNDCLKEHSAELAPACKEFLDKPKEAKPGKEGKKGKKSEGKPVEGKPAEEKPADAMKPAETKPTEPAPSESPPSEPASPGGAESK
jgi:hypothetical protein